MKFRVRPPPRAPSPSFCPPVVWLRFRCGVRFIRDGFRTPQELASEDWRKLLNAHRESFGQTLGRAVAEAGSHGLLARSAAVPRGLNVAIFTQQMTPTTRLSVAEGEALAKWVAKTNG